MENRLDLNTYLIRNKTDDLFSFSAPDTEGARAT